MTKYRFVPTTDRHMRQLAKTMRDEDVAEVWAASRQDPLTALRRSFAFSAEPPISVLYKKRVLCIFGVSEPSFFSSTGIPWMLTSKYMTKHVRGLLEHAPRHLARWMDKYVEMGNVVDARNRGAIRLLKWLGFELGEPVAFGPDALLFHPFIMRRQEIV